MKIKQITLALFALLILATSIIPSTASAVDVGGDTYLGFSSMYLWRGDDLSSGDPVLQGGMDLSFKNVTLSYWSNFNLDSKELDETDIVLDYSVDLNELLSLSVGTIFYGLDGLDDTSELYVGISFKTILEPAFTIYYDFDEVAGDLFMTASIGHGLELGKGLSLGLGALIRYMETDTISDLHNFEVSAALDYAITEQITISPSLIYSAPLSDAADDFAYGDGIDEEFMGGLTLTLSF